MKWLFLLLSYVFSTASTADDAWVCQALDNRTGGTFTCDDARDYIDAYLKGEDKAEGEDEAKDEKPSKDVYLGISNGF